MRKIEKEERDRDTLLPKYWISLESEDEEVSVRQGIAKPSKKKEVREEDESDEENESDGGEHATVENSDDYIPAKKFQGRKPGYVFKKDQSGLGYYLDPVQEPVVNDIETRVATSTKSESPKSVDSDGYVQLESPTNKDSAMTAEDRMKFGMEAKEEVFS